MSQLAVESTPPAVAPGVLGNPPATEVGAAAAFAVAIQLAMGVGTPGPPGAAPGTAGSDATGPTAAHGAQGGPSDKTAEQDTTEVDPGDATTGDALAAALVAGLPVPAPLSVPAPPTGAVAANVSAGPDQEGEQTVPGTTAVAGSPTTAAPTGTSARRTEEQAAPTSPAVAASDASVTGATAPRPGHGARPDVPADQREQGPATGTAPASLSQPVAAAAATTTIATAATVPPPSGHPAARGVATQVVPEVTKLFSNGEGVHRVTLELNPKALGEVRVVLTVRNGDVHVRLAAGTEARQALAHSSAELTRALEHIGVKDHRLTLAELPGVAASAGSQTFSDTADPRDPNAAFTGRFDTEQHHDSRQPRMGDGSTATDGTDQEHGTRSRGDRSVHEVNHVPSRGGVDLRM